MVIRTKLVDAVKLLRLAYDDLGRLLDFFDDEKINDQYYRRLFIRTSFSIIETCLNVNKEIVKTALVVGIKQNHEISWEELVILNEKKISIDNKGNVVTKDDFYNFESSLRFSFNITAKFFNLDLPDYSDNNYDKLKKLCKRRNDITHPRSIDSLFITNNEIKDMVSAFSWYMKIQNDLNRHLFGWIETILKN